MKTSQKILIALLVLSVAQVVVYYPQLPDNVASHFDGSGQPNGWSSKTVFFIIDLATIGMMALVFLFLPISLSRFSVKSMSMPNKDYWLAPERREETFLIIRDQMCWFGSATILFLLAVFQLVISANLDPPPELSSNIWYLLIAFLAVTGWWTIRFIFIFSKTPE